MEYDGTEYNKEHFEKPSVTPERLAEIIIECTQKCLRSPYNKDYEGFMLDVATLISKTLDIREKE